MTEYLFDVLVFKSIGLSLLLVLLIGVRPLVLRHLSARQAYSLWLMVPIFLLLPIEWLTKSGGLTQSGTMIFFPGSTDLASLLQPLKVTLSESAKQISVILWGVGFLVSILVFIVRYTRLVRSFRQADYRLPQNLISQYEHRLTDKVKIVTSLLIDVPAVFGLKQSVLILPKDFAAMSQENQIMILRHELFHLGRGDHQINFVTAIVKCLFWFNPLVYWADKVFEADQEISCDFGVMRSTNEIERKQYAKALIQSVGGQSYSCLISQWKYNSLILERVKMLKTIQHKKWHNLVAMTFAVLAVGFTSSAVIAGKSDQTSVEIEPEPIDIVAPNYPREAAVEGKEGWVKFKFDLDATGKPINLKVVDADPKGVFDLSASEAISQWKFDSKAGDKNLYYTVAFKLE